MTKNIATGYYAVFKRSNDAIEVEFPDLPGCFTSGQTMDEAYELAIDALAGWLELADEEYIPKTIIPFENLRKDFPDDEIMKVMVDHSLMKQYEEKQRFNASFPKSILAKVDAYAKEKGWNRSQFLIRASEKMMSESSY